MLKYYAIIRKFSLYFSIHTQIKIMWGWFLQFIFFIQYVGKALWQKKVNKIFFFSFYEQTLK